MSKADWANVVLGTFTAVSVGGAAWAIVHGIKLIWQSRKKSTQ